MFKHTERCHLPYTPRQMFDLVADVEKYPEFIDWFISARIRHRDGNVQYVDQVVRYAGLRVAIATRAVLDPPPHIRSPALIFRFAVSTSIGGSRRTVSPANWCNMTSRSHCALVFCTD